MKVLVFVDGSEASFRAVDRAIVLGREGAQVTALHVFPPRLDRDLVSHFEIELDDLDDQFAREVLDRVATRLGESEVDGELLYKEGPVAEVVCNEAVGGSYDVILIGGRNEVPARVFDLAEMVRRKSKLPVEIIY